MALEIVGSNPTIHPICVFKAVNDLHSFKHFIGPSPRGKATDFDSVIPRVRIAPAQPAVSCRFQDARLTWWGALCFAPTRMLGMFCSANSVGRFDAQAKPRSGLDACFMALCAAIDGKRWPYPNPLLAKNFRRICGQDFRDAPNFYMKQGSNG